MGFIPPPSGRITCSKSDPKEPSRRNFSKKHSGKGVRYKTPKKPLLGKPDISLEKYKLVIFVDGGFWHGFDWENRKHSIKSKREFWIAKIERIMERDREVNEFYRAKGWTVLRY